MNIMKSITDMKLPYKLLCIVQYIVIGVLSALVIGPIHKHPIAVAVFLLCGNMVSQYFLSLIHDINDLKKLYNVKYSSSKVYGVL